MYEKWERCEKWEREFCRPFGPDRKSKDQKAKRKDMDSRIRGKGNCHTLDPDKPGLTFVQ